MVVVGIGNSGGDIAVELAKVSDQVKLSPRQPSIQEWDENNTGDKKFY